MFVWILQIVSFLKYSSEAVQVFKLVFLRLDEDGEESTLF